MREVTIRELYQYPVKGLGGDIVEELEITEFGIRGDREYAMVGEDGLLVDQKKTPILASITALAPAGARGLTLNHATHGTYTHAHRYEGNKVPGQWVIDKFEGIDQGDEISNWISEIAGIKVRLIRVGEPWTINFPTPDLMKMHGKPKQRFNSVAEVSVTNLASLAALNADLEIPIGIERFRSNVVVDGIGAYEEDEMEIIGNEDVELIQVTPAERCVIITTDQKTGERPANNIFKVLGKTRKKGEETRFGSGLLFGNYMTVKKPGSLYVGDKLTFQSFESEVGAA